jgi:hypothetical protein
MRQLFGTLEHLERRRLLAVTPGAAIGSQPVGALTGRIIYMSGGHGFTAANTTTGIFSTQRGNTNSVVEDLGNQDQMTQFAYYAFNAGATVVPMRPVGYQPNEVVLDNMSTGVTFTGDWSEGGAPAPGLTVAFFSLGGAGAASRYKFATAKPAEDAVARYTPNIPVAGFYPVYAWAQDGSNRVPDQTYRITHTGGATEVKVNHQRVGRGWVYLGTYYFNAGTSGYLEISNKSGSSGVVIADAVRFGNGMGDINRGGGVSGHTREDEASLYWIQKQAENTFESVNNGPFLQLNPTTYRGSNTLDVDANVAAPPRWATYMNREASGAMGDRLFLSFHSNAAGGRGTIGLYNGNNDPASKTLHQQEWALLVAKEINDDLVALSPQLEFSWFNRTTTAELTLDRTDIEFGEIRNTIILDEFDATIAEVAFHDNSMDAALLRDPKVRQWIARSSVQGAVKYFNTYGGGALNFAPDSPTNVRARTQPNGDVILNWDAPAASDPTGDAATGYIIESSVDGYGFDGGIVVPGGATTTYTIPANQLQDNAYYFRVLSTNSGGASPPSVVVGARKNPFGKSTILVVNGFDRFDRFLDPQQSASGLGTFDRVRPRFSNSFDYVVQAGEAIEAYSTPLGFDSCQNEAITNGQITLSNYDTVIWLSGEESTANDTFNPAEQSLVASYVTGGGHLFVSGAEIGFDLVSQGGGATFYGATLRAAYVSDDAGTYDVTASGAGSIFAGISLSFDNGSQFYNVDFPDRIGSTTSGVNPASLVCMSYVGGLAGGAAVQWMGAGGAKVVNFGFPFETITTAANRSAVMAAVLTFFGVGNPAATPAGPNLADASDTGTSPTDDITRLNNSSGQTLQFAVSGTTTGATVSIFADGVLIGSAAASGSSTTVTTNGALALADDDYLITAAQTVSGRPPSAVSSALSVHVDGTAPVISNPIFAFETSHALSYQFNEDVSATLSTGDLVLQNLTIPQTIGPGTMSLAYLTNVATFTFPGQSSARLPDGNYRATLVAAGITDIAGNTLAADHVFDFFFLTADADHDRDIDVNDLGILASNWQQSPRTFSQGDFDYSGTVDVNDLGLLASAWQQSLAPPSAPAARKTPLRAINLI